MSIGKSAPWADWRNLDHESAIWFGDATAPPAAATAKTALVPGAICSIAASALGSVPNLIMAADLMDAASPAGVKGMASAKPTISAGATQTVGFMRQIAIPDYALAKQSRRLASWAGATADVNGNGQLGTANFMSPGGRRLCLLIENVLISMSAGGTIGTAPAGTGFCTSVKFRGYGAAASSTVQSEDIAISAAPLVGAGNAVLAVGAAGGLVVTVPVYGGSAVTAFPHMAVPSDVAAAGTPAASATANAAFSYANGGGVARLWTIVELPASVQPGDVAEIICAMTVISTASQATQWHGARYRFIGQPFPFTTNRTAQLFNNTVDNNVQLGSQPRSLLATQPTFSPVSP